MILSSPETIAYYTERGHWGHRTLDQVFRGNVAAAPDDIAIVDAPNRAEFAWDAPRRLTWRELGDLVERMAARFYAAGLRRDDVISVQLPNIAELAVFYLACWRIGAIASPVAVQYREHELGYLLPFVEAKGFVTATDMRGHNHAAMVRDLMAEKRHKITVFAWGQPTGAMVDMNGLPATAAELADMRDYVAGLNLSANDIVTIGFTSGTEAMPKGVPRSSNGWLAAGITLIDAGDIRPGDRILNPFPMVHVGSLGGMVMPWLMQRGILYQHHPFSMDIFLRQIEEEGITYTVAPPAVLNMLLKSEALAKANISTLRSVGSGSAPLAPWMVKGFQEQYGIAIFNTFGSTEGLALMGGHGDVPDPVRRATYFPRYGRPEFIWANRGAASQETKLIDPATGREILEPNVPGELCTKGAYVFPCYYKNPEKTAETVDRDGFYHSGDTFEIAGPGDDFRYYRYVGRTKDIIIRGGLNISPAELESLIDGHPKLREAAVIGYPDEIMGEKVCVVAATQPGQSIDLREIIDWLNGKHVAVYKLPEKLIVVDALPRNAIGKVLKRDLKALL